jgi:hypothetical protein
MLGAAHRSPSLARRALPRTGASELGVSQVVAEPTRRLVLAAMAAGPLALAGCKGVAVLGPVPKPGTDVIALEHAIAAEEVMVARYEAALGSGATRHVSAVIQRVHAEHLAHLAQLRSRLILPPRLASASPRPSPSPPPLPQGRHRVLAALAAAETNASDRLIGWIPAAPPALAQLMASIAAAEAAHVVLLSHPMGAK